MKRRVLIMALLAIIAEGALWWWSSAFVKSGPEFALNLLLAPACYGMSLQCEWLAALVCRDWHA